MGRNLNVTTLVSISDDQVEGLFIDQLLEHSRGYRVYDGYLIEHIGTHPHNGETIEETMGPVAMLLAEQWDRYGVIIYASQLYSALRQRKSDAEVALAKRMKAAFERELDRRIADRNKAGNQAFEEELDKRIAAQPKKTRPRA